MVTSNLKRARANTAGDVRVATPEAIVKSFESIAQEARGNLLTNPNADPFGLAFIDGCDEDPNENLYPDDNNVPLHPVFKPHTFAQKFKDLYIATPPGHAHIKLPDGPFHPSAPGQKFKRTRFDQSEFQKLPNNCKRGANLILGEVLLYWPSGDKDETDAANLSLVTGYSFYHEHFRPQLLRNRRLELHGTTIAPYNNQARGDHGFVDLWNRIEGGVLNIPNRHALMEQLLSMFLQLVSKMQQPKWAATPQYAQVMAIPSEVVKAVADSKTEWNEIAVARYLGEKAYHDAEWIACNRISKEELEELKGKVIVESKEIYELGISVNAFKEEQVVKVWEDDRWKRIFKCHVGQAKSIILWDRQNPNDNSPTEEKIIGAVLYNASAVTDFASEHTQTRVETEMKALVHDIQTRENCKRGMTNFGTMVKSSLGQQVTNGLLNQQEPTVESAGKNARAGTLEKVAEYSSLRVKVKQARPVIQACNFAFLQGFLPHFAAKQLAVATEAGLLNRYGAPNTQAFASYGYCAAMHIDNDDSVTMGWISSRSDQIGDDESNFVYAEHKLILELDEDTHWVWDAPRYFHGTTLNRVFSQHPKSWKTFAKSRANAPLAQWSRANVLTHNATTSGLRARETAGFY